MNAFVAADFKPAGSWCARCGEPQARGDAIGVTCRNHHTGEDALFDDVKAAELRAESRLSRGLPPEPPRPKPFARLATAARSTVGKLLDVFRVKEGSPDEAALEPFAEKLAAELEVARDAEAEAERELAAIDERMHFSAEEVAAGRFSPTVLATLDADRRLVLLRLDGAKRVVARLADPSRLEKAKGMLAELRAIEAEHGEAAAEKVRLETDAEVVAAFEALAAVHRKLIARGEVQAEANRRARQIAESLGTQHSVPNLAPPQLRRSAGRAVHAVVARDGMSLSEAADLALLIKPNA